MFMVIKFRPHFDRHDLNVPTVAIDKEFVVLNLKVNQDFHKNESDSKLLCFNSSYSCSQIYCSQSGPQLKLGYCATFSEDTRLLSLSYCPYLLPGSNTVTSYSDIQLPRNLSQLNDYMCSPLNRKGLVCSECADGFGPSVTSFG